MAEIKVPKAVKTFSNKLGLNIKIIPKNKIINPDISFNLLTQPLLNVFFPKVVAKIKTITVRGTI